MTVTMDGLVTKLSFTFSLPYEFNNIVSLARRVTAAHAEDKMNARTQRRRHWGTAWACSWTKHKHKHTVTGDVRRMHKYKRDEMMTENSCSASIRFCSGIFFFFFFSLLPTTWSVSLQANANGNQHQFISTGNWLLLCASIFNWLDFRVHGSSTEINFCICIWWYTRMHNLRANSWLFFLANCSDALMLN